MYATNVAGRLQSHTDLLQSESGAIIVLGRRFSGIAAIGFFLVIAYTFRLDGIYE